MHYLYMDFKDRLKAARKKAGFSQQKLANEVGIHVTNISRYERGENKPNGATVERKALLRGLCKNISERVSMALSYIFNVFFFV